MLIPPFSNRALAAWLTRIWTPAITANTVLTLRFRWLPRQHLPYQPNPKKSTPPLNFLISVLQRCPSNSLDVEHVNSRSPDTVAAFKGSTENGERNEHRHRQKDTETRRRMPVHQPVWQPTPQIAGSIPGVLHMHGRRAVSLSTIKCEPERRN